MEKLVRKTFYVEKSLYSRLRHYLILKDLNVSQWVRKKMREELELDK